MKSASFLPLLYSLLVSTALAQPVQQIVPPDQAADGMYRPMEFGPHHRVYQKLTEGTDELGFTTVRTNAYTQIGSGFNRLDEKHAKPPTGLFWLQARPIPIQSI